MHIYIRTGSNENTGITFNDGTQWEEAGSSTGFVYTPTGWISEATRYTPKAKQPDPLHMVPFGERGLAALVLASKRLENISPLTEVQSLTWIRSNSPLLHDLKSLFELNSLHPEELLNEIQGTLTRYLQINTPGHRTEINITKEDLERVKLDNGRSLRRAVAPRYEPKGFTITGEDGTTTHFTVPSFLNETIYQLPDEQRYLAMCYLASEKLQGIPGDTLVHRVTFPGEELGYSMFSGHSEKDLVPKLHKHPTKAGTLRDYFLNVLVAYTDND